MRLEVKTAKLTRSYGDRFESGKIEPSDWLLVLTVEPLGRNPMELATGEKLSSCEMSPGEAELDDTKRDQRLQGRGIWS